MLLGLTDSKLVEEADRERLYHEITATAAAWSVASATAAEIDRFNILQATLLACQRAIALLEEPLRAAKLPPAEVLLTDYLKVPGSLPCIPLVKGDQRSLTISAASILAKVTRDRLMEDLDTRYPGYGLAGHKGYPTAAHRTAIARLGPCPEHRRSFRGVREYLQALGES